MSRFSELSDDLGSFTEADVALIPNILLYVIATKEPATRNEEKLPLSRAPGEGTGG
jgi:hypothetical protein